MTWVKLDDRMPEHPKVIGLSDRAFRAHVEALCYCAGVLTDGRIPLVVAKPRKWTRSAAELVTSRLWEVDGEGWRIHDYLAHQRSKQDADELSVKRAEAGSRGGKARALAEANAKQVALDEAKQTASKLPNQKEREEEKEKKEEIPDQNPPAPRKRGPRQHLPVDEGFIDELVQEFTGTFTAQKVRDEVERALNHKSSLRWVDKRRGVRDWLKRESGYAAERAPTPITRPPRGYLQPVPAGAYEHLIHRGVE